MENKNQNNQLNAEENLAMLRRLMKENNYSSYIVTHGDAHDVLFLINQSLDPKKLLRVNYLKSLPWNREHF